METKPANRWWDDLIEPWVEYAHSNHGFVVRVHELMQLHAPDRKWWNQHIRMWLAKDPARRKQPISGAGILLLEACKAAAKKMESKKETKP